MGSCSTCLTELMRLSEEDFNLHAFSASRKGSSGQQQMASSEVMFKGAPFQHSRTLDHSLQNPGVIGVGRRPEMDQDLMLLLCARAAQTFSKSSQNQAEIPLNKAVPRQDLSKCSKSGTKDGLT